MSAPSTSTSTSTSISSAPSPTPDPQPHGECSICGDDDITVYVPPSCKHAICQECWQNHLDVQLEKNAPAYLAGECPCPHAPKCKKMLPPSFVSGMQSSKAAARVAHMLTTVPSSLPSSKLKLSHFNYQYNEQGVLKHVQDQSGFMFVSQRHYEALGDAIIPELYDLLRTRGGLEEQWLPVEEATATATATAADAYRSAKKAKHDIDIDTDSKQSSLSKRARVNIFTSPDLLTNTDTLCVLIHGSGAVRAGMWARALCINNSLDVGSVLPYIARARQRGWAVAVTNTNANTVLIPDDDEDDKKKQEQKQITPHEYYLSTDRRALNFDHGREVRVPGLEDPRKHTLYVWDHVLSRSPAANIVIVAHSAGGVCAMTLLRQRGASVLPRLRALAFTDSVHEVLASDPRPVTAFMRAHAVNWVTSDKPLDTPIKPERAFFGFAAPNEGCQLRSAGHTKHEWTSGMAIDAVFRYFDQKVPNTNSTSNPTSSALTSTETSTETSTP